MTDEPDKLAEAVERLKTCLAGAERRRAEGWNGSVPGVNFDDLRTILAALAAMPWPDGQEAMRRCTVCTAVVASYPEGMCCHCYELSWPLALPLPRAPEADHG